MALRRPLGFLLLFLAFLAALATDARPALASSAPLLTAPRAGAELTPGPAAAVARRFSIPLLRPSRHRMDLAAPPAPAQAAWTLLSQRLETGSAAPPPPVRASVRVLTGRLNE